MMRHTRFYGVVLAVVLALSAVGHSSAPPPAAQPAREPGQAGAPEAYRIGPEDILQVLVWRNEAMSRTVPVRPDGMISLPLVNDVMAAGLTPAQLRDAVTQKLVEYMPNPEVSVIVTEVRSYGVSVLGEVPRPGRFQLRSWTTVLDVLALAGGFTEFAARNRIVILRHDGKALKRMPFNYGKVISSGEQENFYVLPGDIVLVP